MDQLIINTNRYLDTYQHHGCEVATDLTPVFAGPLAGIAATLEKVTHVLILTVPCGGP